MTIASRTFCQSARPAQFARVLGKADRYGNAELVNAGYTPVLLIENSKVEVIAAASLPLGMFGETDFRLSSEASARSTLFLYSEGITESTDETDHRSRNFSIAIPVTTTGSYRLE